MAKQLWLHYEVGLDMWVLDLAFGRTEATEVVGPPIRWVADTNWKLGATNFTGDGCHVFTTHGFSTQLGLHELKATSPPVGYAVSMGNGHGRSTKRWCRDPLRRFSGLDDGRR